MFSLIRKYRLRKLPPKIVGLMPARNEGARIQFAIKALAQHTDAIIYLDDCSSDDTLAHVEHCREECRVKRILTKVAGYGMNPPTATGCFRQAVKLEAHTSS